jgi:hypothetical protein
MLYGHRCRSPLFWSENGEWKVFGPNILQEAEKQVHMVRENLELHNQGRRAMLIIGEGSCILRLEILCTSRCHL